MKKIARRFRRPSVLLIQRLMASPSYDDRLLAKRLWEVRGGWASRYAAQSTVSQQKRRKAARRRCPHGH